jgi:hypothetical protein
MNVNINELKQTDLIAYNLLKASWLQKSIRRGLTDTAIAIAKLYLNDNQIEGLKRKLLVFCFEDIGLGCPDMILHLKKESDLINQIKILCQSKKNRETDRFLLAVKDFYPKLKLNKEIYEEVETMHILCKTADDWFSNKRKKSNLDNLRKMIDLLKENQSDLNKEIITESFNSYIELSKHNAFGARTALSLICLLSVRNFNTTTSEFQLDTHKEIDLSTVDDWALDKHTSFGKLLNRGLDFWFKEGIVISNERIYPELFLSNKIEKYPYTLWSIK